MDRVEGFIWGRIDEEEYLQNVVANDDLNCEQLLLKVEAIQLNLNTQLRQGVEKNYPHLLEQVSAIETLDAKQVHFDEEMKSIARQAQDSARLFADMYVKLRSDVKHIKHLTLLNRLLADGLRCDELINSWLAAEEHQLLRCAEIVHELNALLRSNDRLDQLRWLATGTLMHVNEMRAKTRTRVIAQLKRALLSLSCFDVATCLRALSLLQSDESRPVAEATSGQPPNVSSMQKELNDIMMESVRELDDIFSQLLSTIAQGGGGEKSATKLLLQLNNRLHSHLEQYQLLGMENAYSYARHVGKVVNARGQAVLGTPSMALRLLQNVYKCLAAHADGVTRPIRDALAPLKLSILSQSLSSLFAVVDGVLAGQEAEEFKSALIVEKLNSALRTELQSVSWDAELRKEMEANVAKTLRYVGTKIEQLLQINADTLQLSGRVSRQQSINYQILNVAHSLVKHWPQPHLSQSLATVIEPSLDTLLATMRLTAGLVLASMHNEKLAEPLAGASSLYMKELCNHLKVFRVHVSQIEPLTESVDALPNFLNHVIEQLALHSSLVRPLNEYAANRFAKDLDYLCRVGLQPFNCKSAKLLNNNSTVSEFFRRFSHDVHPSDIGDLQRHIGAVCRPVGAVPAWLAVHLLINASAGDLPLPHDSVDWSLPTYVEWFNAHTETEHFIFFRNMLSSYRQSIVAKGATQFAPLYPLLNDVVEANTPQ